MLLRNYLTSDSIILNLKGKSKDDILKEMSSFICEKYSIKEKDSVLNCILEREKKMSTGIEFGVAIPHGKTNCVKELCVAIGISKSGVDFASIDKKPSNIIVMAISPLDKTGPHVQFLAEISRLLTQEEVRENILKSQTKDDVLKYFLG